MKVSELLTEAVGQQYELTIDGVKSKSDAAKVCARIRKEAAKVVKVLDGDEKIAAQKLLDKVALEADPEKLLKKLCNGVIFDNYRDPGISVRKLAMMPEVPEGHKVVTRSGMYAHSLDKKAVTKIAKKHGVQVFFKERTVDGEDVIDVKFIGEPAAAQAAVKEYKALN